MTGRQLRRGKQGDLSFQFLHALYILEKTLQDMIKREAIFDIVFFDGTTSASSLQHGTNALLGMQTCIIRL